MSAKKRQTFEKMNRERAVREKRARKQEKKEQRKLAAQTGSNGDSALAGDVLGAETQTPTA
jgi:hypothetical protein